MWGQKFQSLAHIQCLPTIGSMPSNYHAPLKVLPFIQSVSSKFFLQYLLQCDRFSSTLHFPASPMGYPLLVTADGQLCRFDGNNKVLVSKYSHLFQHHLHMFLHPELIDLNYSTDYFLAPNECNSECIYTLMVSLLNQGHFKVHQLPLANSCITYEFLVSLWKCLSHDPVFKLKIDFISKKLGNTAYN